MSQLQLKMWRAFSRKSFKTYAAEEKDAPKSVSRKPQVLSHYEQLQIRRQEQKRAATKDVPPTLLAEKAEAEAKPRPSVLQAVRRSGFGAWMGKLVRQKSVRPSVVPETEECESIEEELGFLSAYLTGDLEVLDVCLQAMAKEQGQRSFVALAERGQITLEEWLAAFQSGEKELRRAYGLLRQLTTEPRQQLEEREEGAGPGRRKLDAVIYTDFQEAPHQVQWARMVSERLVRGTEAAGLSHEDARQDPGRALGLALDGLSAPLRLARACARAAQRGLWQDAAAELRLLWALSCLEPRLCQELLRQVARHLGFVVRAAARKVIPDDGSCAGSGDWEEALLLALRLAQELGRQRQATLKVPDPQLLEALQPKSLLLSLAAALQLLNREVVPRDELCGEEFWRRMASQLLGDVWRLVDQAYESSALRSALAQMARCAGLAPPPRNRTQEEAPLALRSAALASGSREASLGQRLNRPAQVPGPGLPALGRENDVPGEHWGSSSVHRSKERPADRRQAGEALSQLCSGLEGMEKVHRRCAALYGAPFLAERLSKNFGCEITRLHGLLEDELREVLQPEAVARPGRDRAQIEGNAALEAEIREVRRSWNAEVEMQWFDLLRGADSDEDVEDAPGEAP